MRLMLSKAGSNHSISWQKVSINLLLRRICMAKIAQKIVPNLWFDTQAEAAAKFYTSIFKKSKIKDIARYPKAAEEVSGKKAGSVMTVVFEIEGQEFMALNGGPAFKFNESISFIVNCKNQAEVDYF